jgi:hypothetical protein
MGSSEMGEVPVQMGNPRPFVKKRIEREKGYWPGRLLRQNVT